MRKVVLFFLAFLFTAGLFSTGLCASRNNLYEMFEDYPEIKVFLKEVVNETKNLDVKTDVFRNVFYDALKERINIKFIPVDRQEDADVVVIAKISDYIFTKEPLPIRAAPLFINAVSVIGDTAEPKSAAKLVVDYEVRKPEDSEVLFSYKKLTTEVRKPQEEMKGEMGYIYAVSENASRFIYRAFCKQK